MKTLITAFEPWGESSSNSSLKVLERLRDTCLIQDSNVTLKTLECDYESSGQNVKHLIIEVMPDLTLMLGEYQSSYVSIERSAVNLNDSQDADNSGIVRQASKIDPVGPEILRTSIPITKSRNSLVRKFENIRLSDDAGTFVCNHSYYVALNELSKVCKHNNAIFVHIPESSRIGYWSIKKTSEFVLDLIGVSLVSLSSDFPNVTSNF